MKASHCSARELSDSGVMSAVVVVLCRIVLPASITYRGMEEQILSSFSTKANFMYEIWPEFSSLIGNKIGQDFIHNTHFSLNKHNVHFQNPLKVTFAMLPTGGSVPCLPAHLGPTTSTPYATPALFTTTLPAREGSCTHHHPVHCLLGKDPVLTTTPCALSAR